AAHLVMTQPHLFRVFKIGLNMPSGSYRFHHLRARGCRFRENEVVALLLRAADAATDEQEVTSIILPTMEHTNQSPTEETWAFGPLPHREAVPLHLIWHRLFDQSSFFSLAPHWELEGHWFRAGDR